MKPARALLGTLALATALSGCASLNTLNVEVTSYSRWPVDRAADAGGGTYAFERLPSQQGDAGQDEVEAAARTALAAVGLRAAPDPAQAGLRVEAAYSTAISAVVRDRRDGALWWGGAYPGPWGRGFWGPGLSIGFGFDTPVFEHRVDLVLRDGRSREVLYETHARHERVGNMRAALLRPLMQAALTGFPNPPAGPRPVSVLLEP